MTVSRLYRAAGLLLPLSALAIVICMGPVAGAEQTEVLLSYALPEGTEFHYKTSQQTETNFQGMDRVVTQSADVVLSLVELMEGGIHKISLSFSNQDASFILDDQIQDYEPEVKLEGRTIFAFVNQKGEVSEVEASSHIPGLGSMDELKELIEDWFVRLPNEKVTVGQEWRIDVAKQGASTEDEPPEVGGYIDFKLKKIEEKNGITIAEIEGKSHFDINKAMQFGKIVAEGKGEVKTKLAVEGCYILECKRKMDVKGKMVGIDPITGKENESKLAMTEYFECKMQK